MPTSDRSDKSSHRQATRNTGSRKATSNGVNPISLTPDQDRKAPDTQPSDEDQDLYVEDDPLESSPPRPSSAIRWNNPTTTRRGNREPVETTRQYPNVPPRRTQAQIPTPLPDSMRARSGRTTQQQPSHIIADKSPRRNVHWLLYVGVGMIAALTLWVIGSAIVAWGTAKYNDITYGNPRTFQTDAIVGHNDSPDHPSHFIALNLRGQIIIIELPGGNPSKSIDYIGPDLIASGNDQIPVTVSFSDLNKDKKPDMIIHIQDRKIVFCNDGTKFTACNINP